MLTLPFATLTILYEEDLSTSFSVYDRRGVETLHNMFKAMELLYGPYFRIKWEMFHLVLFEIYVVDGEEKLRHHISFTEGLKVYMKNRQFSDGDATQTLISLLLNKSKSQWVRGKLYEIDWQTSIENYEKERDGKT